MKHKIFIITLISIIAVAPLFAQNPFIPKYDAYKRSERCFTVTNAINNQFGSVWWADKIDFSKDTTFNFVVYMGDKDGNGADGMAFVMHKDPRDTIVDFSQQMTIGGAGTWDLSAATGDDGGGLGYAMHQSRVNNNTIPGPHGTGNDPENHKIQPSVAVEIDTYNNGDVQDGKNGIDAHGVMQPISPYSGWDHTSVVYNGDLYGSQQLIYDGEGNSGRILPLKPAYAFGAGNNNIEDDECYTFQIRWDVLSDGTQNLELWVDAYNGSTNTGGLSLVMTHNGDMINNVFGGDASGMRFGFTGSTGGLNNEQTICLLGENLAPFAADDYVVVKVNESGAINIEPNDNDPDNDQLHVPAIINSPLNGQAVVFDSLQADGKSENFIRYIPNTNYTGKDTLTYVTCDINGTKCYAKCDTAIVYITVGCDSYDIDVTQNSPNIVCSVLVPANGAATASTDPVLEMNVVWKEEFEDLPNNTTEDNGETAWSFTSSENCSAGSIIRVDLLEGKKMFRVTNSGCEVEWRSAPFDISSYPDVRASIDLLSSGDSMESGDYINVYYRLDGGPLLLLNNGTHTDDISGVETASINGIKGSTLELVVRALNTSANETYYWDNVTIRALSIGIPGLTYNWYEGNTTAGLIAFTGSTNENIAHGDYTVVAINDMTGCESNPARITIDSIGHQVVGGYIEQLAPLTNCKLPLDGALEAGVYNGVDSLTAGYTFEWYYQEDPKTPVFILNTGPVFSNLESREYAVVVTDNVSGCDTTINSEVVNEVVIPIVTATKLEDITSCSDSNSGSAEANVGGLSEGYNFEWYKGPAIGAGPPDFTTPAVNTFPVGTYTVQAINTVTACTSESRSITINDLSVAPLVTIVMESPDYACLGGTPTGILAPTIQGGSDADPDYNNFTITWTATATGLGISTYNGGGTFSDKAVDLSAGDYTILVTDNVGLDEGCSTSMNFTVTTARHDMEISVSATDQLTCNPDGKVQVEAIVEDGRAMDLIVFEWTISLLDNNMVDVTPSGSTGFSGDPFSGLGAGSYFVQVQDDSTYCYSDPIEVVINDVSQNPLISVVMENPDYACSGTNFTGILAPEVFGGSDSDNIIANYTLTWYNQGTGVALAAANIDSNPVAYFDKAIALQAGAYTLEVMDNVGLDAGCVTTQDYTVSSARHDIAITSSSTDQLTCNPNGSAQVDGITEDGVASSLADWKILLLDAALADITGVNSGAGLSGDPFNNLSAGTYYLQVQHDATKCYSEPSMVIINAAEGLPTATFNISDQVSCDPAKLTGKITADPYVGLTTDYTYEWRLSDMSESLVRPDAGSNGEVISELDAGTYLLQIASKTTGCSTDYTLSVNSGIILPVVSATTTASTECAPNENGSIDAEVLGVESPFDGYTFNCLKLSDGAWSTIGANVSNLIPDDYTITVTDDVTSCVSAPMIVTVADASICTNPLVLTFTFPEEKAEIETEVSLPVRVSGFNGIHSVQYTIEWDPALLEYQRAEYFGLADLNSSSFQLTAPGTLSFSWTSGDGTGQSLADEQELFHLVFKAIGNGGDISDVSFSSSQMPKEVVSNEGEVTKVNYVTGKVSIYEMVVLGGHIQTQHKEALEGIELELIGGMELNTTTDSNGWFSFTVRSHEEYHITPLFDTDSNNGVSTLDIAIMHWHILGKKQNIMSKYDQIAGDINGSKTLTAYDIAATRAVVIHSKDRPKDRNAVEFINDLDYVDAEDVFDYKNYLDIIPTRSHLNFDFTAVKLGDSRGDWKGNGNGARAQQMDEIALLLQSEPREGNKFIVPLKSQDFDKMIGLQFTLEWNPEVVQFDQLSEKQINLISNLDLLDQGLLTVTWNSKVEEGLSLDDQSILSTFEFTALDTSGDPDIKISSAMTPARAYNSSLETIMVKGSLDIEHELLLRDLSVYPNPARDVLHVGGNMTIREYAIISTTGITIYSGKLDASRQLNIKDLKRGVYMLRGIGTDDAVVYRKFIKQ